MHEQNNNAPSEQSPPSTYNGDLTNLAPALAAAITHWPNFVIWKWQLREGAWTKPLYQPRSPDKYADIKKPDTWSAYSEAIAAAKHGNGIGFVLTGTKHLIGIDLDHCRNPGDGKVDLWAQAILDKAAAVGAYVEISVSGTGFHIIGLGDREPLNNSWKVTGAHLQAKVEIYHKPKGRYITVSANQVGTCSNNLPDITDLVGELIQELATNKATAKRDVEDIIRNGSPKGDQSDDFNRVVWSLAFGGLTVEQIEAKLLEHPDGIASRYEGRLLEEIQRCYGKWQQKHANITIEDFYAYMPMHNYIFIETRDLWPGASINSRLPPMLVFDKNDKPVISKKTGEQVVIKASEWLDKNRPIEQMTWSPGEDMVIKDKLVFDGGWVSRKGVTVFNTYRPPMVAHGNPAEATPWIDLVRKVYPDYAEEITKWFAHRVQHPGNKINHGLVMMGEQGIGKDTILQPVKIAVGPWNWKEVTPKQLTGRFNDFAKSVIVRISEARDLGDMNRFEFYEATKIYMASPPDVIRVDEKNIKEYSAFNCCGVIITTNREDSLYLPPGDRRHFIVRSSLTRSDFTEGYWTDLWNWYATGGYEHVAAYLTTLDISDFNSKAPPPKTEIFWQIVNLNAAPEYSEIADILDQLGNPPAITIAQIQEATTPALGSTLYEWITDRKNIKAIPHRMRECGYASIHNPDAKDQLWPIGGRRQVVYAKLDLTERDRIKAATTLKSQEEARQWTKEAKEKAEGITNLKRR